MSVYFRTGRSSAVSFSWPVYLFVIAPLQLIGLMVKGFVYMGAILLTILIAVSRFVRDRWRRRNDENAGTPTP